MPNEFVARRPHPELRPFVSRYVGYRQEGVTLGVHRGLPSRHITLIVSLADPIRVVRMPGEQSPANLDSLVGGLATASALIAQDRSQCGLHLELNPLGVRALLGVSAADLSGWVANLADVNRPPLAVLPACLREATTWTERFELVDEALRASLTGDFAPRPEVGWAWRRMVADGGTSAVGVLAGEVGWSRRHFTERFRSEIGLSPKQAARVVRFERARNALHAGTPLADVAANCGFFDQAHLTHEWRSLAGCTPSTWIAEELPHLGGADTVEA